ncbi:hypothetical protein [Lacticaseibacillus kribbianus]|uniref:hypothetical protein n=1 Tax=Lacticaseibacillus kribbianus TaxID=2926292 RepID=UPI001CD24F53|nr:hypothetical protein [Lacticaseibacillus kribbianus]
MHEIPQTLDAAKALAAKSAGSAHPLSLDTVIRLGLQNWLQELCDEAFEGGYLTVTLDDRGLTVIGITGAVAYAEPDFQPAPQVAAFKADAHATLLRLQTKVRQLVDSGKLQG